MDNTVTESTVVERDSLGNTTTRTVRSRNVFSSDFFVLKTTQIIMTIVAIIDVLVLIRLVLLLLGANNIGIVSFIFSFTNLLVAPFQGIFPSAVVEGGYFETASLVAIIFWLILGYIGAVIVSLFSSDTGEVL